MRKKKKRVLKSQNGNNCNPNGEVKDQNIQEQENWTIISALCHVLEESKYSRLSDSFWETCKRSLAFLRQELGLTNMQIVVLAIMIEDGGNISWKDIANHFECSQLSIMVYAEEIEKLVDMRWIERREYREFSKIIQGFALAPGVVSALRFNKTFVPAKIDGLTEQQFVDRLESHLGKSLNDNQSVFSNDERWMLQLVKANPQLPLCCEVLKYDDIHTQSLLLLMVFDYARWEGSDKEGLHIQQIDKLYPEEYHCRFMRTNLRSGTHTLFEQGIIEHKCEEGQADNEQYVLTRKAKKELLANYEPSHSMCAQEAAYNNRLTKSHETIKEKALFFNDSEQVQIDRLTSMLSAENLPAIQNRLESQGMRKGFACLFYGAPGTGKTETVLQIARKTGRNLMQVDISELRDKFVGESEKNVKEVFTDYRSLCKSSEVLPILFFNEADAIFSKRTENVERSVDKMDNAIQNVILQELEDLDGILIATTNLTSNLDKAFERRFIYKVEFHKPETDVKAKIWQSMIKDISMEDAIQLASRFDLSGGQIENIARKRTVDYILSGKYASMDEMEDYCRLELIGRRERQHIGFNK